MSFNIAIYTDVSADESVDGNSGFGFQAVSEDIDGGDRSFIMQNMLHVVSPAWPVDADALAHPPTVVYQPGQGRYYFSKGKSTGATLSGRRGNQLSQVAVTNSSDDIIPYVPTQLFVADKWRVGKAASSRIDPWFVPVEIDGDYESEALLDWVNQEPTRIEILRRLVSGLDDRVSRKTILLTDSLEDVFRWFSLGTLLLGTAQALEVGLRAFVENPFQTSADLVAVHPDLGSQSLEGAHVIDLMGGRQNSEVAITESARVVTAWVEQLDGFDALEAIELYRRWAPSLGDEGAREAVDLVLGFGGGDTGRMSWSVGISVIRGLADSGLGSEIELYLDEISAAMSNHTPASERELVEAASATVFASALDVDGLLDILIRETINGLAESPKFAGSWARELNRNGSWNWDHITDTDRLLRQLTMILSDVSDEDLDVLLILLNGLPGSVPAGEPSYALTDAITRAVNHELNNPGAAGEHIYDWIEGRSARSTLRVLLTKEFDREATRPGLRLKELLSGAWDYLGSESYDLGFENSSFNRWLHAAKVARLIPAERAAGVQEHAEYLDQSHGPFIFSRATLPEHMNLYEMWIRTVGANPTQVAQICGDLQGFLNRGTEKAKRKDIDSWRQLMKTLLKHDRQPGAAASHKQWIDALDAHEAAIPNVKERTNQALSKFKNAVGLKRNSSRSK